MASSSPAPSPSGASPQAGQPFKFSVLEICDRMKEEFQFLQAQYHSLKLECEKLASEKTEMQRHYVMYYEMSYGLNLEMHKQAEIVKRLSTVCAKIIPFVKQEHQQQVLQAVERAKQVTTTELNSIIGQQQLQHLSHHIPPVPLTPHPAAGLLALSGALATQVQLAATTTTTDATTKEDQRIPGTGEPPAGRGHSSRVPPSSDGLWPGQEGINKERREGAVGWAGDFPLRICLIIPSRNLSPSPPESLVEEEWLIGQTCKQEEKDPLGNYDSDGDKSDYNLVVDEKLFSVSTPPMGKPSSSSSSPDASTPGPSFASHLRQLGTKPRPAADGAGEKPGLPSTSTPAPGRGESACERWMKTVWWEQDLTDSDCGLRETRETEN
ncbi:transducin-like enhancer protein 2 isoform X5 [Vombatus ursinus]|uniref:transducin-like enhancer protein 2 isoform X5 n=1 Tax=Vombatus ursinus TaxID=29139 RepID=UPI000FFD9E37|nr:transducin-like enhancer protein 2 isoform X5 [Vombatus ursinus]